MPRKRKEITFTYKTYEDDFENEGPGSTENPPEQRNAANARERARMRVLSSAFCRLKTKLPNIPPDTKLSKLDTLRLATIYIQQLKAILDGQSTEDTSFTIHAMNSQNLLCAWPFTFQKTNSIIHQHHCGSSISNTFSNEFSSLPKYSDKSLNNSDLFFYNSNRMDVEKN